MALRFRLPIKTVSLLGEIIVIFLGVFIVAVQAGIGSDGGVSFDLVQKAAMFLNIEPTPIALPPVTLALLLILAAFRVALPTAG
jgi:hypothetical protein